MVQEKLVSSEKTKKDEGVHQEKLNCPKIRFPEFDKSWEEVQLKDIASFYKGKGISKNETSEKGIPCIRYGELYTKYDENITEIYSKTNLEIENLVLSEKNDILIPCSGETAIDLATASCVRDKNVAIGGDITIIKTNQYAPFITYCLNNKRTEIAKYAQGVSIVHLYAKDFQNMKIKIPQISEQKKIVDLLENLNKKIDSLEKKLVLYQKILNFNIFKIYSDINDFNEIKLKDIVNPYTSNLSINKLEENLGNYPLYGAEGIIKHVDFYELENPYISIIKDGAGVGRLDLCKEFSSALGTLQCLIPNENIDINFLYFYLKTFKFRKYIVGSTIPHIYFKDYSNERIKVPSLKDQQKIGNYFALLEKRNDILQHKIKIYNIFKQGLLQKMFI